MHLAVTDVSEQMRLALGADGDDIQTRGSVVEPPESNRTTVVPFWVVRHVPTGQ
jgi:hypothetical protein